MSFTFVFLALQNFFFLSAWRDSRVGRITCPRSAYYIHPRPEDIFNESPPCAVVCRHIIYTHIRIPIYTYIGTNDESIYLSNHKNKFKKHQQHT